MEKKIHHGRGKYFHRIPHGINAYKVKALALRDITQECCGGTGSNFFTRNYIEDEYKILLLIKEFDYEFISI